MPVDPEASAIIQALVIAILGLVATGNALYFALWTLGRLRGQPLLAPVWSAADVFLALQAVVVILLGAGCGVSVLLGLALPDEVRSVPARYAAAVSEAALFPLMLLQQCALVGVPVALVCLRYGGKPADLGLSAPDARFRRQLAFGVAAAVLLLPISDLLEVLSRQWLLESGRLPFTSELRELSEQMNAVRVLEPLRAQPAKLAAMAAIIGIVGPIAEEVFFRGFAYQALRRRFGATAGIFTSALLFAVVHGNPVGLVPIFGIGIVLAFLYERTGSLAAPIGLHCANNLLVVAMFVVAPKFSFWDWLFR